VEKHSHDADSTRNIWTKELDESFFLFVNESYAAGTIKVWLMQKPDYDCVFCLTRGMYSGMKKAWEKLA
jgi:hypothetical protein